MPENTPDHFTLLGHDVVITYGPDMRGNLTIHFTIEHYQARTVDAANVRIVDIEGVGAWIIFRIKDEPDDDEGDPRFSFLLPNITLDGVAPWRFETIGIKSTTTRMGPAHQRYKSVALRGEAQFVQTLRG